MTNGIGASVGTMLAGNLVINRLVDVVLVADEGCQSGTSHNQPSWMGTFMVHIRRICTRNKHPFRIHIQNA